MDRGSCHRNKDLPFRWLWVEKETQLGGRHPLGPRPPPDCTCCASSRGVILASAAHFWLQLRNVLDRLYTLRLGILNSVSHSFRHRLRIILTSASRFSWHRLRVSSDNPLNQNYLNSAELTNPTYINCRRATEPTWHRLRIILIWAAIHVFSCLFFDFHRCPWNVLGILGFPKLSLISRKCNINFPHYRN